MAVLFILYIPFEEAESPFIRQSSTQPTLNISDKSNEEADAAESHPLDDTTKAAGDSKAGITEGGSEQPDVKQPEELPGEDGERSPLINASGNEGKDETTSGENAENVTPDQIKTAKKVVSFDHEVPMASEIVTLTMAVQGLIASLHIETDTWSLTDDNNFHQISFVVENAMVDKVFHRLTKFGIGTLPDTSISLFPANSTRSGFGQQSSDVTKTASSEDDFFNSIKSRLTVAQVETSLYANTALTFDFVVLVFLASFIAAMGLAENSSVVLVASMLVSPLMGPILGGVFGLVVQNKPLWKLGLKNEIIGLLICLVVGFLFGFIPAAVSTAGANWGSSDSWPTGEMQSRGMLRSLWVGLLIAIPSGAGVGFSILGGNTGSLVGVAISASLLPPAVNAGMLWAFALSTSINPPEFQENKLNDVNKYAAELNTTDVFGFNVTESPAIVPSPPNCGQLINNNYQFVHSCNMQHEAAILGVVSLFLTLLNIFCIIVMAFLVLKIKEVAPDTAGSAAANTFFKKDIKVARNAYKTMRANEESNALAGLAKDIAREIKEKHKGDLDKTSSRLRHSWHNICEEVEKDEVMDQVVHMLPHRETNLTEYFKKCGTELINKDVHSDSDSDSEVYFTIAAGDYENHFRSIASASGGKKTKLLRRRHSSFGSTPMSTNPSSPATPDSYFTPFSTQEEFTFDEPGIRNRKKNPRFSKQQSCPGIIRLPEKVTVGRFNITKIEEETEEGIPSNPSAASIASSVKSNQSFVRQDALQNDIP